jgi:hypothetical protein
MSHGVNCLANKWQESTVNHHVNIGASITLQMCLDITDVGMERACYKTECRVPIV